MPRKLPALLKENEPERLLSGTARERDRVMLMCCLYLGLRVGELVALQVEHLDFRRRLLTVREGKGAKDRCIPIPARFVGPLRAWVGKRQTGYVFPSPRGGSLTTRAVQKLIKRVAERAGLPDARAPRKYHPHALRHTFATRMLERGGTIMDVRDALGHSSIVTTQIYVHATPEHLRESMEI